MISEKAPEKSSVVLLLGFGSPETAGEVGQFLREMTGAAPAPRTVEALKARYEKIGGRSPYKEITLRQAGAVRGELQKRGFTSEVRVGFRYSKPSIGDAVKEILNSGAERVIALSLSPFSTAAGTTAYFEELDRCLGAEAEKVPDWNLDQGYLNALAATLKEKLQGGEFVIFTAHSVPEASAGAEIYVKQLEETMDAVAVLSGGIAHCLAFQSRGGRSGKWLGPDVKDVLEERAGKGARNVLLAPFGFLCDQLETLYDLDVEIAAHAGRLGIGYARIACLNDSPRLAAALAGMIMRSGR